mgnify:CR=1 FL=1
MLADVAGTYSAVFAPELFVLLCALALLGYEWRGATDRRPLALAARLGILGLAWVVAFAVYQGIPILLGPLPEWGPDATGSVGLAVGMGVLWFVWRLQGWGDRFSTFAALLVAVTVPHLLITPFWDVSSHVLYTVVPAGYLTAVESRFVPLALVAAGMVPARPLAGAHTWPEAIGGLLLGVVFLAVFLRLWSRPRGSTNGP